MARTKKIYGFIPASNEPNGHACMHIWRLPRGSNTLLLAAWSLTLTAVLAVSLTACGMVSNEPADVIPEENPAGMENSENSNGAAEDSSGGVPVKTAVDEKIEKGEDTVKESRGQPINGAL